MLGASTVMFSVIPSPLPPSSDEPPLMLSGFANWIVTLYVSSLALSIPMAVTNAVSFGSLLS